MLPKIVSSSSKIGSPSSATWAAHLSYFVQAAKSKNSLERRWTLWLWYCAFVYVISTEYFLHFALWSNWRRAASPANITRRRRGQKLISAPPPWNVNTRFAAADQMLLAWGSSLSIFEDGQPMLPKMCCPSSEMGCPSTKMGSPSSATWAAHLLRWAAHVAEDNISS